MADTPLTTTRALSKREDVYATPQMQKWVRAYLEKNGGTISGLYGRAMQEFKDRNAV